MKKTYTEKQLIEMGKQMLDARSKGGQALVTKFGKQYFSNLGKLSAEKRRKAKV
jgi:hypothetical protein